MSNTFYLQCCFSFILICILPSQLDAFDNGFHTTWQIDSSGQEIVIPATSSTHVYNYHVNWGDGSITNGLSGNASHTYSAPGIYTVKIVGVFPTTLIESPALISIDQWGNIRWKVQAPQFSAGNMTYRATDVPDLSAVISMDNMFENCGKFNGNLNAWDVSTINSMVSTFSGAMKFNKPLYAWDVSKVTDMRFMFFNASVFNQNLNSWDVSNVTDMAFMFMEAYFFDGNISGWDVSNVKNMDLMFWYNPSFNQDISGWDIGQVTSMFEMFAGANLFNQDIGSWDVSNVENMYGIFDYALSFNQDLSGWDISNVKDYLGFEGSGIDAGNYDSALAAWSSLSVQSGLYFRAKGLEYCDERGRNEMIQNHNWTFDGDAQFCETGCTGAEVEIRTAYTTDMCSWTPELSAHIVGSDSLFVAQSYSWSDGSSNQIIANPTDYFYAVTITDANNCSITGSTIISGQPGYIVSPKNIHSVESHLLSNSLGTDPTSRVVLSNNSTADFITAPLITKNKSAVLFDERNQKANVIYPYFHENNHSCPVEKVIVRAGESRTLSGDAYGLVIVMNGGTLTFTSDVVYLHSLITLNNSTITFSQRSNVIIKQTFKVGSESNVNAVRFQSELVHYFVGGATHLTAGARVRGSIYSKGNIVVRGGNCRESSFIGRSIISDKSIFAIKNVTIGNVINGTSCPPTVRQPDCSN